MDLLEYRRMYGAAESHWYYLGVRDLVQRWIERGAPDLRPRILDAGCGCGKLAETLQSFSEVTCLDIHPAAVELAKSRGLSKVILGDLQAVDFPDGSFDLICSIDVLYHQRIDDELILLRRMRSWLRPGGQLLLHLPAFECLRGEHDIRVHGRRRYRVSEVSTLLQEAGFEVVTATYRFPWLFPALLGWRKFGWGNSVGSDLEWRIPFWIHRTVFRWVCWENTALLNGGVLPVGTSIFAVARRGSTTDQSATHALRMEAIQAAASSPRCG